MGESYLTGAEYKLSTNKEKQLTSILNGLVGRSLRFTLKNDEITVLVECRLNLEKIVRRENRIETGHLTLDDIYFDLVNSSGVKIYFPLVQFKKTKTIGNRILFEFDSYSWTVWPE